MLIQDQFGIIQNLQMSHITQTSFLVWPFFAVSYSKLALVIKFITEWLDKNETGTVVFPTHHVDIDDLNAQTTKVTFIFESVRGAGG